jgi:tetratricopeptide (TPR) repeat protein
MPIQKVNQLLDEGYTLTDHGLLGAALKIFEQATKLDENNAEAWMMQGTIMGELGNVQDALTCLDKAISVDTEYADSHYVKCKLLLSLNQLKEAEASGRKAVQLDSEFGEAWLVLTGIYGQSKRLEEAELCCKKAIEYLPESIEAKSNLAFLLKLKGKNTRAILLYQEILILDPTNSQNIYNLGAASQEQGKTNEAEHYYLQAIKLNPDFADAYSALGDVFMSQKKIQSALINCRKAVDINPLNAENQNRLETVLTASGPPELRRLSASLENNHIFPDMQEPKSIAKKISILYPDEYPEIKDALISLFAELNPGELFSSEWWQTALKRFGPGEKAYDKLARGVLSITYSWSIPSMETLDEIAKFTGNSRLASFGCGRAYWEFLLNIHYGIEISACDLLLRNRFMEIHQQNYENAHINSTDTIFLSWVPKGENSVESILEKMQSGQKLILVGEPPDQNGIARICATNRFFKMLHDKYLHIKTVPVVQFAYHRDTVELYKKL